MYWYGEYIYPGDCVSSDTISGVFMLPDVNKKNILTKLY